MAKKWYWCQDGGSLEAIAMTESQLKKLGAIADAGPFPTRQAALEDALRDYAETLRMYEGAIAALRKTLEQLT